MGVHRNTLRGYISMPVVLKPYRGRGIATELVRRSIDIMMQLGCEEVTWEAEVTNKGALALYGRFGFIRAKRLFRYYLNGVDAFRLKLLFPRPESYSSQSMLTTEEGTHIFNREKKMRKIHLSIIFGYVLDSDVNRCLAIVVQQIVGVCFSCLAGCLSLYKETNSLKLASCQLGKPDLSGAYL